MNRYLLLVFLLFVSKGLMQRAVGEVINGSNICKAAKDNKIDRTALSRNGDISKLQVNTDFYVLKEYTNASFFELNSIKY